MTEKELGILAKENYLNALDKKPTHWQPVEGENLIYTGFEACSIEKGPFGGGYDGFGVRWVAPDSGGGTAIPAPNEFVLKDIEDWKNVQFPDVDAYNWETEAESLVGADRDVMIVDYGSGNGHFERLAALMGFENALISMAIDPEAVNDLFEKITEFKIAVLHKIKKVIDPDTFTLYDDVATQRSPFMSPAAYKELILPHHKRVAEECINLGIRPIIHCCGYAQPLVEYFIEEKFTAWASVQPCNDIVSILNKYGDKICISGGYDTNGLPGTTDDVNIIEAEINRCMDTYSGLPGYIFAGFGLKTPEEGEDVGNVWAPTGIIYEKAIEIAHKRGGIDGKTVAATITVGN